MLAVLSAGICGIITGRDIVLLSQWETVERPNKKGKASPRTCQSKGMRRKMSPNQNEGATSDSAGRQESVKFRLPFWKKTKTPFGKKPKPKPKTWNSVGSPALSSVLMLRRCRRSAVSARSWQQAGSHERVATAAATTQTIWGTVIRLKQFHKHKCLMQR